MAGMNLFLMRFIWFSAKTST